MALITPAWVQVHPSFIEPELLLQYNQASGAFDLLPGSQPRVKISDTDLAVYIRRVDARTRIAGGQNTFNMLPSCNVVLSMIQTATYRLQVRAEYDHHDTAAAGEWNVSIVDAYRYAMRQGHFQILRNGLLYGYNPVNGEGLINTQGATFTSLPPDSNNNQTVTTYDNGQMAFWLLQQVLAMKTRTMQLGIGRKFTFLGPQRTLGLFEYNVVQLVQYQRVGAGTHSTAGVLKDVAGVNDDEITWVYDDTLIGQGASGTDAVVLIMPEIEKPEGAPYNTNEFARLSPGLAACTAQYTDMAAPREIPTPLAGGAIDVLSEWRVSSGWGIRPEAVAVLSMSYP
jgi:hypothetical protein